MTPEQERRLRELPSLIAGEKNSQKMISLADELRDLTTLKLAELRSKSGHLSVEPSRLDEAK